MVATNKTQRQFYEAKDDLCLERKGNFATRFWRHMRRTHQRFRADLGIQDEYLQLHRDWMGPLTNKSVLDLGCHTGNKLSIELAAGSRTYTAIDLSPSAIEELRTRITRAGLQHKANFIAADFLTTHFSEPFDVIYAHGVMHHFRHLSVFLEKLKSVLSPRGCVITFDPMQTDGFIWLARQLYRPFQSDRDWEWPFTKQTFPILNAHFAITDIQGILGSAKWSLPVAFVAPRLARTLGTRLHAQDKHRARTLSPALFRCMQVTMRLSPLPC